VYFGVGRKATIDCILTNRWKNLREFFGSSESLKNIGCINGVNWERRCTGVHIFEDAKFFCQNLIVFFPNNVKLQVLM